MVRFRASSPAACNCDSNRAQDRHPVATAFRTPLRVPHVPLQVAGSRRRANGVHLAQYLRPVRRSLSAATPRWLLALLLSTVALAGLHLGHFHSDTLSNMHVQPPRMPLHTTGPVVAARDVAMVDAAAVLQGSNVQAQGSSSSGDYYYNGTSRTLSFNLCGGFAQQRVALLSGEMPELRRWSFSCLYG